MFATWCRLVFRFGHVELTMRFLIHKRIWLPAGCILLALLAPAATYIAVSHPSILAAHGPALIETISAQGDASPVTVVTTGEFRWACVLMHDADQVPTQSFVAKSTTSARGEDMSNE